MPPGSSSPPRLGTGLPSRTGSTLISYLPMLLAPQGNLPTRGTWTRPRYTLVGAGALSARQAQASRPRLGARVPTDRPYHYHARHWAFLRHEHAITPPAGSGPDPSSDSDTHRRQPPEDHRSGPRVPHSRPGIPAVSSSEDSKDTQRTGNSKKGEPHAARKDPTSKSGAFASELIRPATYRGSEISFLRHR